MTETDAKKPFCISLEHLLLRTLADACNGFPRQRGQAAAIGVEQPICGRCIAACPCIKKYLCRNR